ncbi:MAG: dUTP diphosphatase [Candidatus Kerfeldbacteria bacterium CG08_land_8_20_14_0_20_43_14]|uniref:dUTP diphosphatase n=1 Tax=Candidatus Kerfeldbacteria bacterium CG08_land_8_20_14_0_20_43_14 TaxID=2014246 RepID=A0A2H0YPT6_9BACT|nr:MAG: dUTP diphosphatase [Candidatus Kerfeldbacteria bacterium CG08_land_8_20_14_0_20_43_14]
MKFKVKILNPDAIPPKYAHEGDAGLDVFAIEDYVLQPGERHVFKLGFSAEFESGYVCLVWDRSGLAAKQGLTNLAGVIDASYRGEYAVVVLNTSNQAVEIKKGDRIAQMLIQSVQNVQVEVAEELSESKRSQGGFGSTGK